MEAQVSDLSIPPVLLRSQFFDSDLILRLALRPDVQPTLREGGSVSLENTVMWFLASLTSAIGAREFFLFPLCRREGDNVAGLILQHTGVQAQYRRLGLFTNLDLDVSSDVINFPGKSLNEIRAYMDRREEERQVAKQMEAHRSALDPTHYEDYNDEDGQCTITII